MHKNAIAVKIAVRPGDLFGFGFRKIVQIYIQSKAKTHHFLVGFTGGA